MRRCCRGMTLSVTIWIVMFIIFCCVMLSSHIIVTATEQDAETTCRAEMLEMLMNADKGTRDISAYRLTSRQVGNIWNEMIEEEGYLPFHLYGFTCPLAATKTADGYVKDMYIFGIEGTKEEFQSRYRNALGHIEIVQEMTKNMSDVEKVLFVHDYLVEHSYYQKSNNTIMNQAGGPIGNGYGVCGGYTDAITVLLKYVGIETLYVVSGEMKHQWSYVLLDNEWYHVDATWDDTRSSSSGEVSHHYFIRNDEEFQFELTDSHYNWKLENDVTQSSTLEKYSDWFVHDIIGRMHYEDGLWYYIDNNTGNIVRSKLDMEQTDYEVIIDREKYNASKLKIVKIENSILYYSVDGLNCEVNIEQAVVEDMIVGLDWSEADYWRSGQYNLCNGTYQEYYGRICLKDYLEIESGKNYQVQISDDDYRILIRELNSDKQLIASWNVRGGNTFFTSAGTKYLAISMYSRTLYPTFEEYCDKFESGMKVKVVETEGLDLSGTLMWSDEKYWRSGCYMLYSGKYRINQARICLLDYLETKGGKKFEVKLSNDNYHMLIRELSGNKGYITTHDLVDGELVTLSNDTSYLAISLYNPSDGNLVYETYLDELEAGMEVGLIEQEVLDVSESFIWDNAGYWRSGHYSMVSGIYEERYTTRICLQDYVAIDSTNAYEVALSDDDYHMLIREMTGDKSFIKSHNMLGGEILYPSENTEYLAISLYMPANDGDATYEDYLDVIQAGVGLQIANVPLESNVFSLEEVVEETTEEIMSEIEEEETTEEITSEVEEEETTEEIMSEIEEEETTEEIMSEIEEEETTEEITSEVEEEETTEEITSEIEEEETTEEMISEEDGEEVEEATEETEVEEEDE